jgi:DNA gyrase subunit A
MADSEETVPLIDANGDVSAALGVEVQEGDWLFDEVISKNFLTYALSVLTDRALPDVRDGLLPVQRRILYSMVGLGLRSKSGRSKCALIVGECMGKYHPHGDSSIYGALVRMSQTFSLRAPLIDFQGNNGSLDGDGAAAMRYTEARLSAAAEEVLGMRTKMGEQEINALDEDIIPDDYGRNYSESLPEALVLPAAFPNMLVNGNTGIAVGMTHNTPPHNPGEILDLTLWRIAHPEATDEQVVARLQGPDFPTGALVVQNEAMRQAYLTGEGKITVIGEAHIEPMAGNRERVVITSLPFGVMKGSGGKGTGLVEVIAKQHQDGKWPELAELYDKSTDDIRIELELKRGTNARACMARLYKDTRLRNTTSVQMNVLVGGRPRTLNFPQILDEWIKFRTYVIIKVAEKRLREIETRLHRVDALLKALSAIDEVIKTLKASKNRADAKPKLQTRLGIDEQQAEYIVQMPLGNITSLETTALKEEQKQLLDEAKTLRTFIKTPEMVAEKISEDLRELKKVMARPRMTKLIGADSSEEDSAAVTEFSVAAEDCVLLIAESGQTVCGQGTLQRGASLQIQSGDRVIVAADARTDEDWIIFTAMGKALRLRLAELPVVSRRDKGVHLSSIIGMEMADKVVSAHKLDRERVGTALFVYASGMVKRTDWSEYSRVVPSGIVAAAPKDGDAVAAVFDCPETADIVLVGSHGKGIRFAAKDMRSMGRAAAGVRGMNIPATATLIGSAVVVDESQEQLLLLTDTRFAKRIPMSDIPSQGRGGGGVSLMKPGGKYGAPAHVCICRTDSELWLQRDGKLVEFAATKVTAGGRAIVPKLFEAAAKTESVIVRAPTPVSAKEDKPGSSAKPMVEEVETEVKE